MDTNHTEWSYGDSPVSVGAALSSLTGGGLSLEIGVSEVVCPRSSAGGGGLLAVDSSTSGGAVSTAAGGAGGGSGGESLYKDLPFM